MVLREFPKSHPWWAAIFATAIGTGLIELLLSLIHLFVPSTFNVQLVNWFKAIHVGSNFIESSLLSVALGYIFGIYLRKWIIAYQNKLKRVHGLTPSEALSQFPDKHLLESRDAAVRTTEEYWEKIRHLSDSYKDIMAKDIPLGTEVAVGILKELETYQKNNRDPQDKVSQAQHLVVKNFFDKLVNGDIVASGYECPFTVTSTIVDIPPTHWRMLEIDFKSAEAKTKDGDIRYVGVRFHKKGK